MRLRNVFCGGLVGSGRVGMNSRATEFIWTRTISESTVLRGVHKLGTCLGRMVLDLQPHNLNLQSRGVHNLEIYNYGVIDHGYEPAQFGSPRPTDL